MEIYTIGYTRKTAEEFFGILRDVGIRRVIDVRLHNTSQLAAFTKRSDLPFFLKELCDAEYIHEPLMTSTKEMLDTFRKHHGRWEDYTRDFMQLLDDRELATHVDKNLFAEPATLLCSEATPEECHRRLVAEYLQQHWDNVSIIHL